MNKRPSALLLAVLLWLSALPDCIAQECAVPVAQKAQLLSEHLYGGAPSAEALLIRRAYVSAYDQDHRVPRWAAWHAAPEYLSTPPRKGKFARFRSDTAIRNPVVSADYDGLLDEFDYARGHLVPYFISGGDRNKNGKAAASDLYDACTVFEINYMTNIAPQLQSKFNGAGGLWYKLETLERTKILAKGQDFYVVAGSIFGPRAATTVGPDDNIYVPHMFFRILIAPRIGVVPFLFVHEEQVGDKGCGLASELETCIVALGDVEHISKLKFFPKLPPDTRAALLERAPAEVWRALLDAS